jgi:SNF family Na+-dependent transporter
LYWQHGWHYGLAMALIAAGMAQYVKLLEQGHPDIVSDSAIDRAMKLASAQGIGVSVVLLWLVASGKILTPRSDWAANLIFVAGGLSIVCMCAFVTKSYHELTRARDASN